MLYLAAAIVCTSAFALIMRQTQRLGLNQMAIMAINYTAAALAGVALTGGQWHASPSTLHIGLIAGVVFVTTYFFIIHSMDLKGVAIANAIVRLSVLIPIVASIALWDERPGAIEALGGALALVALPLLALDRSHGGARLSGRQALLLLGLFITNGLTLLTSRWFHSTHLAAERPVYSAILFGTAAVASIIVWTVESRRVRWAEWLWGTILGLANILTLITVLKALVYLPGTVVFPVMGALGLALTVGYAAVMWQEKPGRLGLIGISIAVVAVVLVNAK